MSKETLKLALEALEAERDNYQDWDEKDGAPEYIYEAITALREALAKQPAQQRHISYACPQCHWSLEEQPAQQQEPVKHELQCICGCSWEIDADGNEELVSSPPAQQQEPVAWNVIDPFGKIVATEKDAIRGWARIQGYKPTVESLLGFQEQGWRVVPTFPPAQRTWVGLTQDEFRDFASTLDYGTGGLIRAIEAKLKEKNT